MQTATGVAAGALAFEGIESLMHGFGGGGHSSGFDSGFGGSGGRPEEIVNNYYGDSSPGEHRDEHLSSDIEDRRGDAGGFDGAVDRGDHNYGKDDLLDPNGTDDSRSSGDSDTDDFDDNSGSDDSSMDDGGGTDSSSFDDGN